MVGGRYPVITPASGNAARRKSSDRPKVIMNYYTGSSCKYLQYAIESWCPSDIDKANVTARKYEGVITTVKENARPRLEKEPIPRCEFAGLVLARTRHIAFGDGRGWSCGSRIQSVSIHSTGRSSRRCTYLHVYARPQTVHVYATDICQLPGLSMA